MRFFKFAWIPVSCLGAAWIPVSKYVNGSPIFAAEKIPYDTDWDKCVASHKRKELSIVEATRTIILITLPHMTFDKDSNKVKDLTKLIPSGATTEQLNKLEVRLGYLAPLDKFYVPENPVLQKVLQAKLLKHPDMRSHTVDYEYLNIGMPFYPSPEVKEFKPYNIHDALPFNTFVESARPETFFRKFFHRCHVKPGTRPKKDEIEKADVVFGTVPTISYLICRVLQLPPECWPRFNLRHCSITKIKIDSNGVARVEGLGECTYMKQRYLSNSMGASACANKKSMTD